MTSSGSRCQESSYLPGRKPSSCKRTEKSKQEVKYEKAAKKAADKQLAEKIAAIKQDADKLATELLDKVNKAPGKEQASADTDTE